MKRSIVAISLVTFCLFILPVVVRAQISPGELSKAHAHLEGITHCLDCHASGEKITNNKCLGCHTEIAQRINENHGYHASVEVKGKQCSECHTDHQGRDFEIIQFDKENFNHKLTGYELVGEHARIECEECHKKENIRETTTQRKEGFSYLGLNTQCVSCHKDYHQQTLSSTDCASCHGLESFRPAPGFDHQQTAFPLKGAHQKVECIDCHKKETRNSEEFQHFAQVAHARCTNCHEDVHDGKFGQDCLKCHNENSFKQAEKAKAFDHNLTDFPLIGKHQSVDCRDCHETSFINPINSDKCSNCHEDYHNTQFTAENKSSDCADCHTNYGFTPSTYTLEQHKLSQFSLSGAHTATACKECHQKTDRWEFRNIGKKCADCHEDEHLGYIDAQYYPNKTCENCHSEITWQRPNFDHKKTGFELLGEHAKQECRNCHYPVSESGKTEQRFSTLSDDCTLCHNDVHFGQFDVNHKTDCLRCHDNNSWKIETFDHNKTSFNLEGGHIGVACIECHKPVTDKKGSYIQYKFKEVKCSSCHSSPE